MQRFYLPPERCAGANLELTGREAHHAVQVLRLRRGEVVQVLDGKGQILQCTVAHVMRDQVSLEVIERSAAPEPGCRVTLLQALPKGKLFDSILQKSTELGVSRIVPLITERVVAQFDREDAQAKTTRWRQVLVEAVKQCGSPWLPIIEEPVSLREFLTRKEPFELSLFGSLQPNARHPREYFKSFARGERHFPASVAVWIGPEGDFTPAEAVLLESASVSPITLGPLVLRTETAALYCLSVVNYECLASSR